VKKIKGDPKSTWVSLGAAAAGGGRVAGGDPQSAASTIEPAEITRPKKMSPKIT
jgi:hypothetical protein